MFQIDSNKLLLLATGKSVHTIEEAFNQKVATLNIIYPFLYTEVLKSWGKDLMIEVLPEAHYIELLEVTAIRIPDSSKAIIQTIFDITLSYKGDYYNLDLVCPLIGLPDILIN
jgi:hypothetical protein